MRVMAAMMSAIAAATFLASPVTAQVTLAGDAVNGGTTGDYVGQSFVADGVTGQSYDHINFAFLYNGSDVAYGHLYIFSAEYSGQESQLASYMTPTGTFLGVAAASNNTYQFSSLTLTAGSTYYAYMDTNNVPTSTDTGNHYAGGQFYRSTEGDYAFKSEPSFDNDFRVTGSLVDVSPPAPTGAVPEPATWAMMMGGFAIVGGVLRRRGVTARAAIA